MHEDVSFSICPRWRLKPKQMKKRGSRKESKAIICFLPDVRGGLVGIMEARKPDRQGRLATLLASSLPRFISYCHVVPWLGLLMSVHVCLCALYMPVAMWVGPEKMVEAI